MARIHPAGYDPDQAHVFVCYAHSDGAAVYAEIDALRQAGVNVWYDEGLYAGSEWPEELANAITDCARFLYFVSPASVASRNCRDEVQYARERSKSVVAVHLEETQLPPALQLTLGSTHALKRYQLDRDAYRAQLVGVMTGDPAPLPPPSTPWRRPRVRERIAWAAAVVLVVVAALIYDGELVGEQHSARFAVDLPAGLDITPETYGEMFYAPPLAISPDGTHVVFSAQAADGVHRLYRRSFDQFDVRPIEGTNGASAPIFSPDSATVGFVADRSLKKIPLQGGDPETILRQLPGPGFGGASWGGDDTIVYAPSAVSGLFAVPAGGGQPRELSRPDDSAGELGHSLPQVLPGTDLVLMSVRMGMAPEAPKIAALQRRSGERVILADNAISARFSAGHVIYAGPGDAGGSLWAAPLDLKKLALAASPTRVVEAIGSDMYGVGYFDVSPQGSLAFVPPVRFPPDELFWLSRDGSRETVAQTEHNTVLPALAPDGLRVALTGIDDATKNQSLWMVELGGGPLVRLSTAGENSHQTVWTPDGGGVVFTSDRAGPSNLYLKLLDTGEPDRRLTDSSRHHDAASFAPDGRLLTYVEIHPDTNWDIWVLDMETLETRAFLATPAEEIQPIVSPDGALLAYTSRETGRREIYLEPFPNGGNKRAVSAAGGEDPVWDPSGTRLYYRWENRIYEVPVTREPDLTLGAPRVVFEGDFDGRAAYGKANWDISSDGARFLMSHRPAVALEPRIMVVLGQSWQTDPSVR